VIYTLTLSPLGRGDGRCERRIEIYSATAGPAASSCLQIRRDKKSSPVRGLDEIDLNGLDSLEEVLADDIGDTFLSENLVIFAWFIQNQAQRGPRSATLVVDDPNRRNFLLVFEGLLDHFSRFLRNVKHRSPPVRNRLTRNPQSAGRVVLI
jgi:hypothetical protein